MGRQHRSRGLPRAPRCLALLFSKIRTLTGRWTDWATDGKRHQGLSEDFAPLPHDHTPSCLAPHERRARCSACVEVAGAWRAPAAKAVASGRGASHAAAHARGPAAAAPARPREAARAVLEPSAASARQRFLFPCCSCTATLIIRRSREPMRIYRCAAKHRSVAVKPAAAAQLQRAQRAVAAARCLTAHVQMWRCQGGVRRAQRCVICSHAALPVALA